jgi:hypothetical protein
MNYNLNKLHSNNNSSNNNSNNSISNNSNNINYNPNHKIIMILKNRKKKLILKS